MKDVDLWISRAPLAIAIVSWRLGFDGQGAGRRAAAGNDEGERERGAAGGTPSVQEAGEGSLQDLRSWCRQTARKFQVSGEGSFCH